MNNNLLLEIGTEEIPAKLLQKGLESLEIKGREILQNNRIPYAGITVWGTPRRLVLLVNGISDSQEDIISELRGPAKKIAFDLSGKITDAGTRFAEKCGIREKDLTVRMFKDNEYVFAIKKTKGLKAVKILPEILPQIIKSLSFPKQMRWEQSNSRFVRPVRWITALFNDKVIKFSFASINSSRLSFGHRLKGNKPVSIKDALSYKADIEKEMVVIDQKERRNIIARQLDNISKNLGASVVQDDELLDHVANLVEYPNAIAGDFDDSYLELPPQVLITVMKEQQKYFALEDKNKKLLPKFIVVTNSFEKSQDLIRQGNEWVFKARLNDAKFFWNEDRKNPFDKKLPGLEGIVFQNKLGTIADKVKRIKMTGLSIAKAVNLNLSPDKISLAFDLCKLDLLTEMVKEFPTLQGFMGKYYYLSQNGDTEIAEAVYEHYLPRFANDILPETNLGALLSISDKIDNITAFFLLDKIPTGSEDPFALRRQANGILQIIWRNNYSVSLTELIKNSVSVFRDRISKENIEQELIKFFMQRFRNLVLDEGIQYDCLDAVLSSGFDNPLLDRKRAGELMNIYNEKDFPETAVSFSRVTNILKNISASFDIKQELLTEDAEKDLFNRLLPVKEKFTGQIKKNNYHLAYNELKPLRSPIDKFFDKVLVMDKNKEIQQNRLNLLYNIASMFYQVADFSKIVIK